MSTREATVRNAVRDGLDRVGSTLAFSRVTHDVLARHRLLGAAHDDPAGAALQLEVLHTARTEAGPVGPLALALAELWYRDGLTHLRKAPATALLDFRNAAAAALIAVSDPRGIDLDAAVAQHNDALARVLRLAQDERVVGEDHWTVPLAGVNLTAVGAQPFVRPDRFRSLDLADDLRVRGMRHEFRTGGLGVPVVGLRPIDRAHPAEPGEAFFPPRLRIGATALVVPAGGLDGGAWRLTPAMLVFHDPFATCAVRLGGRAVPLARDTTAPLAVQASQRLLSLQTTLGLFLSDFQTGIEPGLYMLRPWQPGKIPLVFVHGLNSNPAAFVQALNELRNDPLIAPRYQFLLFAYPTGRPIPTSAMRLRRSLYQAEKAFGADPAFHQMVLAGHSMGGLLTRMMVVEPGDHVWNAMLTVPREQLRASPDTLARLEEMLKFHPVPFVRRAVFIAAPHRGSYLADEPIGRIVSRFIQPPAEQAALVAELKAANGPSVFREEILRDRSINSVGNLSVRNPLLLAVADLPVIPGVPHHTIAFQFAGRAPTDLVVPSWSSQIDGGLSHLDLPGTHFSEQSPGAVAELRRILIEHLEAQAP